MSCPAFLQFWWTGRSRDTFLSFLPKEDLASLRLACHDFSARAAPVLFEEITVTFRASIFTKPARMAALDRIGHHVRSLEFRMPHGPETFLPPLLDPSTGEEVTFIYEPYVQSPRDSPCRHSVPTYGSWEMTDMLVKQYPPLFHAAANVPSFIRALSSVSNLKHLKISCPGQEVGQRYRRSIVDYALISLRMAVERSKLSALDTLSLNAVHASSVIYLNPTMGFGALPNSTRRWRQIKTLTVKMDSVPFAPHPPADHLKMLNAYLQVFAPSVKRLTFRWLGSKGLCPLTLHEEICLQGQNPKLACPRRSHIALPPLKFPKLRKMEVENVVMDASQISGFITSHRRTLSDFNFEDTKLRSGTWDQALKPLTRISGSEKWKEKSEEVMDVPLMLSSVGLENKQAEHVVQEFPFPKQRTPKPCQRGWRAGAKLLGTPDHMRRFLRSSVFTWI